jgi:two-component system sensor histidine kinase DesK
MTEFDEKAAGGGQTRQRSGLLVSGLTGRYLGTPGTGSPRRWFFISIWLLYLIGPINHLFHGRTSHDPARIAVGVAIAVAFCVIYIPLVGRRDRHPRLTLPALGALMALSVLACVIYGQDWLTIWIYTAAAAGSTIASRPRALLAVAGVVVGYSLTAWISHCSLSNYVQLLLPVALIGVAMIGFQMQIKLMHELGQARETVAKLAASEERLRVTRDMHDLTGQSLSMITLKSDLARKLLSRLPESEPRSAALTEMEDIGRVSRQTLHDIREALSGYRRPTLAIEIITARTAFEAAGIALDDGPELTLRSGSFDPEAEAVLAWCLRESVTNVIRHSGAHSCRVRLRERAGELSLEVTDDGRGLLGQETPAAGGGTGLHGMSERLSAVGGKLSLGAGGQQGRGLRLVATVPARPNEPGTARKTSASTPHGLGGRAD